MSRIDQDKCKHKRKSITTHGRKSKGIHFCKKCGKRLQKKDFQKGNFRPRERKVARRKK